MSTDRIIRFYTTTPLPHSPGIERYTGRCRTSPYSSERKMRNDIKRSRNRQNRIKREEFNKGGRGSR